MPKEIKGKLVSDDEAIEEVVKANEKLAQAKSELKLIKKEAETLRELKLKAEEELDTFLSIKQQTPAFTIGKSASKKEKNSLAVPLFLWSDWHVEEVVSPSTVGGKNEFDLGVAEKRIQQLGEKSIEYALSRSDEVDIPEAVVWLGGDFMTGYIHEEMMPSNLLSPVETVLWVKPKIRALIEEVANAFGKVKVVCNVGNHGRTNKKKWTHNANRNSYEWLMYHVLADEMRDNKNITFVIPDGYFCEFDVFGYKVRTHHGDSVMYWGGVGGPSISINKAVANWDVAEQFDYDYFGHLHQFIDHQRWVMNGSLIGYTEFSIKIKAKFQKPLQVVDFIHAKHGRTDTLKVYLD